MNKRELEDAIRDEIAEWPGCSVEFENPTGTGHPKAKLMFGDLIMRRPYSGTPSDADAIHIHLGQIRRTLKQMGAERPKPEPSKEETAKRYAKPNPGREMREPPKTEPAKGTPDIAEQLVAGGVAKPIEEKPVAGSRGDRLVIDDPHGEMSEEEIDRTRRQFLLRARIDAIVDGVYFDLPDEVYHGVERIGSTDIKNLAISPADFWRGSWLDPAKPELDEDQTAAQKIGKAYHCARLEPDRFPISYARDLSKDDFPKAGFLSSDEKVKAELKSRGMQQTVSGETTAERAERLLDSGYEGTIWPLEKARFDAEMARREPRPILLPAVTFDEIATDMQRMHGGPVAQKLSGGEAEVSVFWTDEHGLKCKARFDYLKAELWSDLKSFDNPRGKNVLQCLVDAFQYNYGFTQAVHYRDAAEAIRVGGLQIIGDATDEQRKLIASIQIRPTELACWYIYQQKKGVPNLFEREVEFNAVDPEREHEIRALVEEGRQDEVRALMTRRTRLHRKGRRVIEQAKRDFMLYSEVYPPGVPWSPIEPSGTFGDMDFQERWLDEI